MRNTPNYIALLFVIMLTACKHDIINNQNTTSADTTVVVAPPVSGGTGSGTTPAVSDTVCFNTDILPLYVSYCGSAG